VDARGEAARIVVQGSSKLRGTERTNARRKENRVGQCSGCAFGNRDGWDALPPARAPVRTVRTGRWLATAPQSIGSGAKRDYRARLGSPSVTMIGAGHSFRQSGWTMIAATNPKAARMRPTRPYRAARILGIMDGLGLLPVKGRLHHSRSNSHAIVIGVRRGGLGAPRLWRGVKARSGVT
jgi:hypothetical protein